jgi:hypothetical protein
MEYLRQLNNPADDFAMIPRKITRIGLSVEAVGYLVCIASMRTEFLTLTEIERATGLKKKKRLRIQRELCERGLMRTVTLRRPSGTFYQIYEFNWDVLLRRSDKRENSPGGQNGTPVIDPENQGPEGAAGTSGAGAKKAPKKPLVDKSNDRSALSDPPGGQKGALSNQKESAAALAPSQSAAARIVGKSENVDNSAPRVADFAEEFLAGRRQYLRPQPAPSHPPSGLNGGQRNG